MRKSKQRVTKAVLSFLICICLVFQFTQSLHAYTDGNGLGDLVFNERREIAQGVFWIPGWARPLQEHQSVATPFLSPENLRCPVLTFYGDTVSGRATLSRMIADAEAQAIW